MQFSKVIEESYRYVENNGVLFKVVGVAGTHVAVWPLQFEEVTLTAVVEPLEHSSDSPTATLETSGTSGEYYGNTVDIVDRSFSGMKIAVELLQSGWRVGQLTAIRRLATPEDVEVQEAAILAALKQL